MPTVRECRRLRLLELIAGHGGQAEVARITGKDRRQVSAWATGRKAISDGTADELARAFRKPRGWMDRLNDSPSATPPEPEALVGLPSQPVQWDSESLTEAERWVRFEEGAGANYTPEQRAKRFAALYDAILADGGRLSPEHCEQVISAARERQQQGDGNNGDGGKDGGPKQR